MLVTCQTEAQDCDCFWYARAEALFLRRDDPEALDLVEDEFLPGDPAVLTTRTGQFNFEPGVRVTVGRQRDSYRALEASYFGIHNWNAAATVTSADPGLDSLDTAESFFPSLDPFVLIGTDFDTASFFANTEVHSFELNCRRALTDVFTFLAGFRYIRVDDRFDILTSEIEAPFTGTRQYNATTTSDLFGLQIGGEAAYDLTSRLAVELKGKAGLHLGYFQQDQTQFALTNLEDPVFGTIPAGTTFFAVGDDGFGLCSTVEVAIAAVFALTEIVRIRAGYEVMVWNGLALAPEQLNDSEISNEVHRDGIIVISGASVGLDVIY